MHARTYLVSFPDPILCKEKGLTHFEQFLVIADSAYHMNYMNNGIAQSLYLCMLIFLLQLVKTSEMSASKNNEFVATD